MSTNISCIVLAGGLGTRLRNVLPDTPKCLAPVQGHSFLEIQLRVLSGFGIDRIVLSLGYLADKVIAVSKTFEAQCQVEWLVEKQPLGTGGAILHAMNATGLDEALVVNGDTLLDGDLGAMRVPLDRTTDELMRVAAVRVEDRTRYGGLETERSRVTGFLEKGTTGPGLINAGLYRLRRSIFSGIAPGTAFSLETEIMPKLVSNGTLTASALDGSFIDIGVPEDYYRLCARYA